MVKKVKFNLKKEYEKSWNYLKDSKKFIWIILGIFFGFALLAASNTEIVRYILLPLGQEAEQSKFLIWYLIVLVGALGTLYYAFNFKKTPPRAIAGPMVVFGAILEVASSIFLFLFSVKVDGLGANFFQYLNSAHALFIIVLLNTEMINHRNLDPKNAKPIEIVTGLILVGLIYLVSAVYLGHHWSLTFAIMVSYSMIFNDMLSRVIIKR